MEDNLSLESVCLVACKIQDKLLARLGGDLVPAVVQEILCYVSLKMSNPRQNVESIEYSR